MRNGAATTISPFHIGICLVGNAWSIDIRRTVCSWTRNAEQKPRSCYCEVLFAWRCVEEQLWEEQFHAFRLAFRVYAQKIRAFIVG